MNNLSLGYSVQQYITELTLTDSNNPAIQDAKYFISISNNPSFSSSSDQSDIRNNAFVLESIAYRTLFSYIQLQNPANLNSEIQFGNSSDPDTNFVNNIAKLREGFALIADPNSQEKFFTNISQDNAFKNSTALMSMSRSYDYYVSLKMLMAHNVNVDGLTDYRHLLPPTAHGLAVNDKLIDETIKLYEDTRTKGVFIDFLDVNYDEIQVGNWPIIAKAAIGYAVLGMTTQQGILPEFIDGKDHIDHIVFFEDLLRQAFIALPLMPHNYQRVPT
jgi:hypothetical protein